MDSDAGIPARIDDLQVLEPQNRLLRDLRTSDHGVGEAERRLVRCGPDTRCAGGPKA